MKGEVAAVMQDEKLKKKPGFGSMNPEKVREIARKGGKAAHARGVAHEFTSEKAREAGRKGGLKTAADRRHMREIGIRGGHASKGPRE